MSERELYMVEAVVRAYLLGCLIQVGRQVQRLLVGASASWCRPAA
jgi:hypothetical protein